MPPLRILTAFVLTSLAAIQSSVVFADESGRRGFQFDFGTAESVVHPGWLRVTAETSYSPEQGFGLATKGAVAFDDPVPVAEKFRPTHPHWATQLALASPPPPIYRPDLAIGPADIEILTTPPYQAGEKIRLRLTIHDLGSAPSRPTTATIQAGDETKLQVPAIEAPTDLRPGTWTHELEIPVTKVGCTLRVSVLDEGGISSSNDNWETELR